MNLSTEEKQIVASIWKMVAANLNTVGVDLFIRLFSANPDYQNFFSFRDVPDLEKLRNDKRLKAHVRNVMYTLAMVVDNLDEPDVLQEMIDKIARTHVRRKLNKTHFVQLKVALIELLTEALGLTVMNEQAVTAWGKTYDLFIEALVAHDNEQ